MNSGYIAISANGNHTLALRVDGVVVAWGDNRSGQLNIPADLTNVVAIDAGGEFSLARKADGSVVAWGTNFYRESSVPPSLNNAVAISGGSAFSLALYAAETTPPTTDLSGCVV